MKLTIDVLKIIVSLRFVGASSQSNVVLIFSLVASEFWSLDKRNSVIGHWLKYCHTDHKQMKIEQEQ
jgi:hypothetical protein